MQGLPDKDSGGSICASLTLAGLLMFGVVETSSAVSVDCVSPSSGDVVVEGMAATACGFGDTNNDFVSPPPSTWSVNTDNGGTISGAPDWNAYYRSEIQETEPPSTIDMYSDNPEQGEAPGAAIDLQLSFTGTDPDDPFNSGDFTFNNLSNALNNPFLVVLKEGAGSGGLYAWYYFEGKPTGELSGSWDTTNPFDGRNLSHMTIYEMGGGDPPSLIPVPAAVWLFGSGLLGLVGVARRKKAA